MKGRALFSRNVGIVLSLVLTFGLITGDLRYVKANGSDVTTDIRDTSNLPGAYPASASDKSEIEDYLQNVLPPTRDQGRFGTCWAFATTALAECYMVKKENVSRDSIDYSERHLVHYVYSQGTNPLVENDGDSLDLNSGDRGGEFSLFDKGGYISHAAKTLFKWRGLADESVAPYPTKQGKYGVPLTPEVAWSNEKEFESVARLKDCYIIDRNAHLDMVKQFIKEYGAVGAYMLVRDNASETIDNKYYNADTGAFYNNEKPYNSNYLQSTHAVAIVGWDDNYPRRNFRSDRQPSRNGAWLVRNSWGAKDKPTLDKPTSSSDALFKTYF